MYVVHVCAEYNNTLFVTLFMVYIILNTAILYLYYVICSIIYLTVLYTYRVELWSLLYFLLPDIFKPYCAEYFQVCVCVCVYTSIQVYGCV